ncbi:hypothetical protein ACFTXM_08735 [Streptomyces sp. NPDC056930]|uniref:hypothetical protein n=1 Tax=Streptomyces sp. NPDC056930 TaxID=3345967 RepID=UPI003629D6F4
MSQPRRGSTAPTRHRVERTDLMAKALLTLRRDRAIAVLAKLLYNASDELIAEKLQVSPTEADRLSSIGLSQLRHPTRTVGLSDVSFERDEGALVIDRDLRSLLDSWRMEEMFGTQCAQCQLPLEAPFEMLRGFTWRPKRPGRPRSYCSNACRQKAYRIRARTAPEGGHADAVR